MRVTKRSLVLLVSCMFLYLCLSSYKHFGRSIIESVLGRSLSEEDMNYVYQNTYDHFVEEIDGNDNGIDAYTGSPQYKVTTTISSRVSRLGISWTEEYSEEKELERFRLAMGMVFGEFTQRVHHEVDEILPARSIVKEVCATERMKTRLWTQQRQYIPQKESS